jgi:Na+:H+ antiporter, NhaA family
MRIHADPLNAPLLEVTHPRFAVRLFRAALNRFLLLPLGVAIAMVWANTDPESYFRFAQAASFPVNEIAMAFFLALVAQELFESLMQGGALSAWRHRTLPAIAAAGGLFGAVVTYLSFVSLKHEQMLVPAWPVVAAIDLAAGYYLLRLIYPRRSGVVAFMLLTAVLTDAIVIAVASVQTPSFQLHPAGAGLLLAALASAALLRRRGVKAFGPYWLISGALSWLAFYWMGIHPALALVPIVPLLPHDTRAGDVFADRLDGTPVHHQEHEWNGIAQVAVLLFGLANGGVILRHADTGTWGVLIAALVGRPLGIMAALFIAVLAGLRLPARMRWSDIAVAALATTCGFTFGLFLGAATLPVGAVAEQVTLGALLTVIGAFVTLGFAWAAGAGRFKVEG